MKTIETDLHISKDRTLSLTLPAVEELQPGVYHIVMIIDEQSVQTITDENRPGQPLNLKVFHWDGWPTTCTFRREDLYEDEGR